MSILGSEETYIGTIIPILVVLFSLFLDALVECEELMRDATAPKLLCRLTGCRSHFKSFFFVTEKFAGPCLRLSF